MSSATDASMILDDLFRYNDWANERIFRLCDGLADELLDQRLEMGFGSLRAILFHLWTAEQIWWERWTLTPWRPFPTDPGGTPLAEIAAGLRHVAELRRGMLHEERSSDWSRVVTYRDSKGNEYSNPLRELMVHVANHGIHHRAQVLHFLKKFGRTVPAGIDYIFFRLARPTIAQEPATAEAMAAYGLEINSGPGVSLTWDANFMERYFAYHDWANDRILTSASQLDDHQLDHAWNMGPGSIRQTLLHLLDAERWWYLNWTQGPSTFPRSAPDTPLTALRSQWHETAQRRREFMSQLDDTAAQRVVAVIAGGPESRHTVLESLIQLCGHGTHHRAQLLNMLRRSGLPHADLDTMIWLRS